MFTLILSLLLVAVVLIRLCFILPCINVQNNHKPSLKKLSEKSLLVLLGSGGHTGEMLRLMESVDTEQLGRVQWVVSSGDTTSASRLKRFLESRAVQSVSHNSLLELSRARRVGEGIMSSLFSVLKSLKQTIVLVGFSKNRPDVLVLNGPGTAVPLCLVVTWLNFIGISNTRIVYVESLARVLGLSLSGRICYYFSHRFIVQWPSLKKLYPRAEYYGILV